MAIAGKVALTPKGVWSADTTYEKLDIVSHNGSAYVSRKSDNVGNEPTNDEFWMFMVSSGSGGGGASSEELQKIIDGTTQVGDSKKLGGKTEAELSVSNAEKLGGKGASEYALQTDLANYLPINGSGTMTGAINLGNGLGYVHSYSNKTELEVKNSADDTVNKRRLTLWNKSQESDINNALMLYERKEDDSGWNRVTVLHTGNINQAPTEASVRTIQGGTVDLTAGTSELAPGQIYAFYEAQ